MQEFLAIEGGARLDGTVRVAGAKNAALPLLIATLLSSGECRISNVPDLDDIAVTLRMLRSIGARADYAEGVATVFIPRVEHTEAPYSLVKAMRASFWVLGPLLARAGEARVALPGGDAIGVRPVDLHLKGLVKLGADIRMSHGSVVASAPSGLHGGRIALDYPSVGATHQLLMTSALIEGETVIAGAAREPEIVNVADFLRAMGAEIEGAGEDTIRILGRRELGGAQIEVIGDRIEAATYLVAGAMTGGNVTVRGIDAEPLAAVLDVLHSLGCETTAHCDGATVVSEQRLGSCSIETAPYPGVATDMQPLLMAAMCTGDGTSAIRETVFESRFGHVAEYRRLGAQISIDSDTATIRGVRSLSAAPVNAPDIRAAAGLILLGLCAEGVTELHDVHHLDRGYDSLIEKFSTLGARLRRSIYHEHRELILGC